MTKKPKPKRKYLTGQEILELLPRIDVLQGKYFLSNKSPKKTTNGSESVSETV